jgi:hypothetical protein
MGYPALLTSAARTASATGTETNLQNLFQGVRGALFTLNVTAAANLVGDTLDVYIQQKIKDNWDDLIHFTQVLGNGGAKVEIASLNFNEDVTADFHNPADATMAAATLRKGPITGILRAKYVIAGGAGKSFTFDIDVEILK